jgi:hypothetical protein
VNVLPTPIRQPGNHNTTPESSRPQKASLKHRHDCETFGIGEDVWRDDLIGCEGLARVDEGGEDGASFLAFACKAILLAIWLFLYLLHV